MIVTNNDYIDLGLPSGTLWAYRDFYRIDNVTSFTDYMAFSFHLTNLIPTTKQFKELYEFCKIKQYRDFYLCISKINGNKLILFDGYYETFDKVINIEEIMSPDRILLYHHNVWCLRLIGRK